MSIKSFLFLNNFVMFWYNYEFMQIPLNILTETKKQKEYSANIKKVMKNCKNNE